MEKNKPYVKAFKWTCLIFGLAIVMFLRSMLYSSVELLSVLTLHNVLGWALGFLIVFILLNNWITKYDTE